MKTLILGAAGFIGTNLALCLRDNPENELALVDKNKSYFIPTLQKDRSLQIMESTFDDTTDFDTLLQGQEIVYHLVSTTVPTTSNQHISQELQANVIFSSNLFEACVRNKVKKVVFISSGGTVYGREADCPLKEKQQPIRSHLTGSRRSQSKNCCICIIICTGWITGSFGWQIHMALIKGQTVCWVR